MIDRETEETIDALYEASFPERTAVTDLEIRAACLNYAMIDEGRAAVALVLAKRYLAYVLQGPDPKVRLEAMRFCAGPDRLTDIDGVYGYLTDGD